MIADGDTDGYWSDSSQPLNVVYELKDEQKLLNDMIAEDDVGQDNDDKQASETLVACSAYQSIPLTYIKFKCILTPFLTLG